MNEFAKDREVIDAATPGPWESHEMNGSVLFTSGGMAVYGSNQLNNSMAVARARTRWPAALDTIKEQDARIAELEAEIERLKEFKEFVDDYCVYEDVETWR